MFKKNEKNDGRADIEHFCKQAFVSFRKNKPQ